MVQIKWKALRKTKDIIVENLRVYLSDKNNYLHLIPPEIDGDHYTKTVIFDSEPEELRQFPLVIITNAGGSMVTSSINDFAEEVFDPLTGELMAYKHGGMYELNITLEIGTKSTLDREVLSDLISIALRFILRRKIQAQGVIIKSMNYGGESTLQYDSNHIYVATISLSTWSEWHDEIELLPNDITAININEKNNLN